MEFLLIAGIIILPVVMLWIVNIWGNFRSFFNVTAVLSAMIFGIISSISVHEVIVNQTVMMTTIHAIFLNPFFIISGSYLGLYLLYRLLIILFKEKEEPYNK
ncbi:hypothetical protein [Ornithinibacillus californiensis]|uniref:hypothetical protein n=1 Tax=Ornithinibacillus californiensis TaxID=161536 RepID=UPI00064D90C1|nr:hypothetical protein [Ornithinibacillus californiensis]